MPAGWSITGLGCVEQTPTGVTNNATTTSLNTSTGFNVANIKPDEGENIVCTYTNSYSPTAALVSVSGRVTTANGNGIRNAQVMLQDLSTGATWRVSTGSFGYYSFDGLEVGDFYMITVGSRRYTFTQNTRTFSLVDNLDGVDFVADF
jgi:hypothetical protein